jgi:hypothetical protein
LFSPPKTFSTHSSWTGSRCVPAKGKSSSSSSIKSNLAGMCSGSDWWPSPRKRDSLREYLGAKSRSGVRSQESGVRSQESGVRSQESGVRSYSELSPGKSSFLLRIFRQATHRSEILRLLTPEFFPSTVPPPKFRLLDFDRPVCRPRERCYPSRGCGPHSKG